MNSSYSNKKIFYDNEFSIDENKLKFNIKYEENIESIIDLGINKLKIKFLKSLKFQSGINILDLIDEKLINETQKSLKKKIFHSMIINDVNVDYQWDPMEMKSFYREKQSQRISCIVKNKENLFLVNNNVEYLSKLLGNIIESLWSYNLKSTNESKTFSLTIVCNNLDDFLKTIPSIMNLTESIFLCKYLGITPPNYLYPKSYSNFLIKHFKNTNVNVKVLGEEEMKALKMGAILSVGQGSPRESQLVLMKVGTGSKRINFIGKGVTFDTGGSNLKPGHFADMKYDMMGSATVVSIMDLLSKQPALLDKFTFIGAIGLVENQIGGYATLPSDVVTNIENKTIEILNTDAEGRVVLSDVIGYCKKIFKEEYNSKPDTMIIFATLTGSIVECLSETYSGLFSNNNKLSHQLMSLGEETGDLAWLMPCNEYYDYVKDNPIADIGNIYSGKKGGGAIKGAKFLEYFIGKDIDFAYFDIAGVSDCIDRLNSSNCPTGYGIKLINQWIQSIE